MSDNGAEFELLRAIGQVRPPAPGVLEDAREGLWSAVASAMLDIGPVGEQATTTRRSAAARRRQPGRSQNGRRMSAGGADPGRETPAIDETTVDPWNGIDGRLDAASRAEAVMSAVRALPAGEREVLLLVAWERLAPADAAKVLGIPPGTARSRLHRARATLRQVLQHDPDQGKVSR